MKGWLRRSALTALVSSMLLVGLPSSEAQNTNMKRAHEAFQKASAFKAQGDLVNAQKLFRIAVDSAPADSNIRHEAVEQLTYTIPLMKIQRLIWDGEKVAAERELLALQQKFEDQPVRRQQIGRIVNGLRASTDSDSPGEQGNASEQLVMRQVKALLHGFYVENKRYPASESDLASLLPADQPPLRQFEIKGYSSNGGGYLLVLRSKKNADHILTIQKTGLMQ